MDQVRTNPNARIYHRTTTLLVEWEGQSGKYFGNKSVGEAVQVINKSPSQSNC